MDYEVKKPIEGISYENLIIIGTNVLESFNPAVYENDSENFNSVKKLEMRGCYLPQLPRWFRTVTHYKLINARSLESIACSSPEDHGSLTHLEIKGTNSFYNLSNCELNIDAK